MNQQLTRWANELRQEASNVSILQRNDHLEAIVWDENAAQAIWDLADQLGIPEQVVRVTRPVVFLQPYPGSDVRNHAAQEAFQRNSLRVGADGKQILLSSFEPVSTAHAQVLILGSMPGALSLRKGEYYAHARNRFWWLMEQMFHIPASLSYVEKIDRLGANGIALWDVLHHCERVGSLDKNIAPASEVANDIVGFIHDHPLLTRVVLNGRKAEHSFRKLVRLEMLAPRVIAVRPAPSTSPANAAAGKAELLFRWRSALQ